MSWGDGVPNPFDEAKDQTIRELNEALGEKEKTINRLERFLDETRVRLMGQRNPTQHPALKRANEELIDSIERVLHP